MSSPLRDGRPFDVDVTMAFVLDGNLEAEPIEDVSRLKTEEIVKLVAADCLPNRLGIFCARGALRGRANYFHVRRDWAGKDGPLVQKLFVEGQDFDRTKVEAESNRELTVALSQVRMWMRRSREESEEICVPGEVESLFCVVIFLHHASWTTLSHIRSFCDTFQKEGVVVHIISMGGDDSKCGLGESGSPSKRPFLGEDVTGIHLHSLASQGIDCVVASNILRKDGVTLLDSWMKNFEEIPPSNVKDLFEHYEKVLSSEGNRARASSCASTSREHPAAVLSSHYAGFCGPTDGSGGHADVDLPDVGRPSRKNTSSPHRAMASSMFCGDQSRMIGSGRRYLRTLLMTEGGEMKMNIHRIEKLRKAVTEPLVEVKVGKLLPVYGRNPGRLDRPPTLRPDMAHGVLRLRFLTLEKLQLSWMPRQTNIAAFSNADSISNVDSVENIASIPCTGEKSSNHVQVELLEEDPTGLSFCIKAGKGAGMTRKFFWLQEAKSSGLDKLALLNEAMFCPKSLSEFIGMPKSEILLIISVLPLLQASIKAQQKRSPHPNLLPVDASPTLKGKHPQHSGIPLAEDTSQSLERLCRLDLSEEESDIKEVKSMLQMDQAEGFSGISFPPHSAVQTADLGVIAMNPHEETAQQDVAHAPGLGQSDAPSQGQKRDEKVTLQNLFTYMKDKDV